jgi:hypothetical protein
LPQRLTAEGELKEGRKKMARKLSARFVALFLALVMLGGILSAQSTRIRFRPGSTSTSVTGTLPAGAKRQFILGARDGQNLSATVSSRNGCVVFSNGSGTSLNLATNSGSNFVSLENNCGGGTSYTMTISIY